MTDKPVDQQKLEAAVSKVAKAYQELVGVVEKGTSIDLVHVSKSFGFLATVHSNSEDKSLLSLNTALAANGSFSLDKEYAPSPRPSAEPVARERLIGAKSKRKTPPPVIDDDEDGVGFVDS